MRKYRAEMLPAEREAHLEKERIRMRKRRGQDDAATNYVFRSTARLIDLAERRPDLWPQIREVFQRRVDTLRIKRPYWTRFLYAKSAEVNAFGVGLYRPFFKMFPKDKMDELRKEHEALRHPMLDGLYKEYYGDN